MANLAALRTLRTLREQRREPTDEERSALAGWSGWGALPAVFEPEPTDTSSRVHARWRALSPIRTELRELLSEQQWNQARRNTLNAHYTHPALAEAMWQVLRACGFDGGRVLEPGSGIGTFIGAADSVTTAAPVQMVGIELEEHTAALARHLHPDAQIITGALEQVRMPPAAFDAAIGNVPFSEAHPHDAVLAPHREYALHDLAVLKAVDSLRPGRAAVLITSRYTMDAFDRSARVALHERADLLGAIRLPAGAHRSTAGTDVVTDVLVFRRRDDGEPPANAGWLDATRQVLPGQDEPVGVNEYFVAHPEHVLGELRARIGRFGTELTVTSETTAPEALAGSLAELAAGFASQAPASLALAAGTTPAPLASLGAADGVLGVDEHGQVTVIEGGRAVPLEVHPSQAEPLAQLVTLKQQLRALYDAEAAEQHPGETPDLAELRRVVRESHRAYRRTHPPLSKPRQRRTFTPRGETERQPTAFALFEDDPDSDLVFGLEEWDEQAGCGVEQAVLSERVLQPRQVPTRADTPETALALALEHDGGDLHLSRVAALLGTSEDDAALQIGHLAFRDPARGGEWEPRARYLSGDVRTKLDAAREAARTDPTYSANVAALREVQPADLTPADIHAKPGAAWIPEDVYETFLHDLGLHDARVRHAGRGVWEVSGARTGDLARTEWGTDARPAGVLFEALLRQADSTLRVTWRDTAGNTIVDEAATARAREQATRLGTEFRSWVWRTPERAARLARAYNDVHNRMVPTSYDTGSLHLPGMVDEWQQRLRPHQNAAIRRIVNNPTALLAHVVGAGKTATMVAGAMELRRTGLATKPALVVPNHMLKQITREFTQLYPTARLCAISASDLSKSRRGKFMARIAAGEWDTVVLTHEAFRRLPVRPETQKAYMDLEVAQLREQLETAQEAGMGQRTVKQVETMLATAEARVEEELARVDRHGVFLEDTGIDYLFVDEAHEFKNLRTISAIPGAQIDGSAKATKLHMVLDYLRSQSTSGRVATFATGTPIANSVTEAYVLQRYLAPERLAAAGLEAFDQWAATFGEVISQLEPDPKGEGYRLKSRFARFFNVPELMQDYRLFADVQTAEDLGLPTPPVHSPTAGERGETILLPPADGQRDFLQQLPKEPWVNQPGGVLKALGRGLRASLDMRLVGRTEEEGSKLEPLAEQILTIWRETKDLTYPTSPDDPTPQEALGGLQIVFLDEGTPGGTARHGVDLYADLRDKLTAGGIPAEKVRFIHEAGTDAKKARLFADCRAGHVSVLLGSTQKLGTGANIQRRAVALHHVSYPWRPADMSQRDGRIERQGNLNMPGVPGTPDNVRILYYVTERTFDEFRLNALARKARFIAQIQNGDPAVREIEDIGDEAMNLAMLQALASGDPAIMQQAEANAERHRLIALTRSWDQAQEDRATELHRTEEHLTRARSAHAAMREALPHRLPTSGDDFCLALGDAVYRTFSTAADALGERLTQLARDTTQPVDQPLPLGQYGGFDVHAQITYGSGGSRFLRVRFPWQTAVPRGHRDDRGQWPASKVTASTGHGALMALNTALRDMEKNTAALEEDLAAQQAHRDELATNLRPHNDNPYRQLAESKTREEGLLTQLIPLNERYDRLTRQRSEGSEESEETATLAAQINDLRARLDAERERQQDLTAAQEPDTPSPSSENPATLADSPPPVLDAPDLPAPMADGALHSAAPAADETPPAEMDEDPPDGQATGHEPTPEPDAPAPPADHGDQSPANAPSDRQLDLFPATPPPPPGSDPNTRNSVDDAPNTYTPEGDGPSAATNPQRAAPPAEPPLEPKPVPESFDGAAVERSVPPAESDTPAAPASGAPTPTTEPPVQEPEVLTVVEETPGEVVTTPIEENGELPVGQQTTTTHTRDVGEDDRTVAMWPGNGIPSGRWERHGDTLHDPYDGRPMWRLKERTVQELDAVESAYREHVGDEGATDAANLVADLNRQLDEAQAAWGPRPDEGPATADETDQAVRVGGVAAAFRDLESRREEIALLPEWQQLQTIRGALAHTWKVLKERAAEKWAALREDIRFQGVWKTVMIRWADKVAELATAAADRLRRSTAGGPLPAAEALLKTSDAAVAFSNGIDSTTTPAAGAAVETPDIEEVVNALTETGETPVPQAPESIEPYVTAEDARRGEQDAIKAFRGWIGSDMGQALAHDDHPQVAALRTAWKSLPAQQNRASTAGPWGAIASHAAAVHHAAQRGGHWGHSDMQALADVVTTAHTHAARLAQTLPTGAESSAVATTPAAAAPRPAVAAPAAPAPSSPVAKV